MLIFVNTIKTKTKTKQERGVKGPRSGSPKREKQVLSHFFFKEPHLTVP